MDKPFVSVVCPTYIRPTYLPWVVKQFLHQNYPQDRMELIILDDSPTSNADVIKDAPANVRYEHSTERMRIGVKRNKLNEMAKGDIIVCMDDDDLYSGCRVSHAVNKIIGSQWRAEVLGNNVQYIYNLDTRDLYSVGPFGPRDFGSNNGFVYTKDYTRKNKYSEEVYNAEEVSFMQRYRGPIVTLDPEKTLVCISHGRNTTSKDKEVFKGVTMKGKTLRSVLVNPLKDYVDHVLKSKFELVPMFTMTPDGAVFSTPEEMAKAEADWKAGNRSHVSYGLPAHAQLPGGNGTGSGFRMVKIGQNQPRPVGPGQRLLPHGQPLPVPR